MEKTKIKLGVIGAGNIAHWIGRTVRNMDDIIACAVASRDLKKAQSFASEYKFEKAFGSYRELLADDEVDLVYIATPHSHHAGHMMQCIEAGKNILCEKSFCLNAHQAYEVLTRAEKHGVFVAEAMWVRYMPMAKVITDFAKSGKIGRIHSVMSCLGYPVWEQERVHSLPLGGGALLDVGIYNLNFASMILGDEVSDIEVFAKINEVEKTDEYESVMLNYKNGSSALLYNSIVGPVDRRASIYGDKGYALIDNVNHYQSLNVYDNSHNLIEQISAPKDDTGYEYEIEACAEAIRNGMTETPYMPHSATIKMLELADRIREKMGLKYPNEDEFIY